MQLKTQEEIWWALSITNQLMIFPLASKTISSNSMEAKEASNNRTASPWLTFFLRLSNLLRAKIILNKPWINRSICSIPNLLIRINLNSTAIKIWKCALIWKLSSRRDRVWEIKAWYQDDLRIKNSWEGQLLPRKLIIWEKWTGLYLTRAGKTKDQLQLNDWAITILLQWARRLLQNTSKATLTQWSQILSKIKPTRNLRSRQWNTNSSLTCFPKNEKSPNKSKIKNVTF